MPYPEGINTVTVTAGPSVAIESGLDLITRLNITASRGDLVWVGTSPPAGNYENQVLFDNPLLFWRCSETAGASANDSSPNNKDGVIDASVTLNQSLGSTPTDPGFLFNGNGKITVADATDLTEVTLEAVMRESVAPGVSDEMIFGRFAGSNGTRMAWIGIDSAGKPVASAGFPEDRAVGPVSICDDDPHHLAATFENGGDIILYVDGEEVARTVLSAPLITSDVAVTAGGRSGVITNGYNGLGDEFAYYSTALSEARIQSHALALGTYTPPPSEEHGTRFPGYTFSVTGQLGQPVSATIPATDLIGWEAGGEAVDVSGDNHSHTYTFLIQAFEQRPGNRLRLVREWSLEGVPLPQSISTVDLDTIQYTTVETGATIPIPFPDVSGMSADIASLLDHQFRVFTPEEFDAVGDRVTNDTAAVQAAIDAASAWGAGGVVFLRNQYGCTGDLLHKGGVTVIGTGNPRYTVPEQVEGNLVALDATFRYRYGQWGGGSSANDNPGALRDVTINGNYLATELFRAECVDAQVVNCHIIRAASSGKCIELGGSQNSTFDMVHSGYGGRALSFDVGVGGGQSAGMIRFNNCYFATSDTLLYGDTDPAHFPPHEILFSKCLFEDRGGNNRLVDLRAGEWQFTRCIITNSDALAKPDNDCLIHITNPTKTDWGTEVTIDSCYLNGGSSNPKVTDAIRIGTAGSVTNEIRVVGRNRVTNVTNLLCFDGINARTSILGTVSRGAGVGWFRAINGGDTFNVRHDTPQPYRWVMPVVDGLLPKPLAVRTEGDLQDRWWVERDGKEIWGNGLDTVVRGSKVYDSTLDAIKVGGLWRFENAFALRTLLQTISAPGQAVAISGARTAAPGATLSFAVNGATANVTLTDGVFGSQFQIILDNTAGVTGSAVTWPSNIKNAPQPVRGRVTVVNLVKGLDDNWYCVSHTPVQPSFDQVRSSRISGGQETLSREFAASTGSHTSQLLRLTYFTAYETKLIGSLRTYTGATAAAATPTTCKMGLYRVESNGDLTRIGITANDTALWAAANTGYTRALTASAQVDAGVRYALATLVDSAATVPVLVASTVNTTVAAADPRLSGGVTAQTDIPASILAASVGGSAFRVYGELIPA